jgi:tRNA modification GTPase
MKFDLQRTIVAVSSGAIPSRRAIVRLSGALTHRILDQLLPVADDRILLATAVPRAWQVTCSLALTKPNTPAEVCLTRVPALLYFWPDSRSFTGEACAELHLIGSMPIVEALVAHLCSLGAAPAERGEFTLRSFLAGKLDLIQAEAVLGVIEAEGPNQLHAALSQLGGNLSTPVREMRDQLVELIAHLEAGLDFVDEDIEFISHSDLILQLTAINQRITALSEQLNTRDARSRTAQIVIVGLPNSGKSSLFNCLAGQDRAIVSPLAGTTRDVISQSVDLDGMVIELIDTAGIEELLEDSPRAEAQLALQRRLQQADIALFCIDSSASIDRNWQVAQAQLLVQSGVSVLTVGTKSELLASAARQLASQFDCLVSVHTGVGIAELRQHLANITANHRAEFQSAALQHIAVRCRQAFASAVTTIDGAIAIAQTGEGEELVSAELRIALDELAAVIGEIHSDDILGEIFSRFCIGK